MKIKFGNTEIARTFVMSKTNQGVIGPALQYVVRGFFCFT